jgi:hypothetical protein
MTRATSNVAGVRLSDQDTGKSRAAAAAGPPPLPPPSAQPGTAQAARAGGICAGRKGRHAAPPSAPPPAAPRPAAGALLNVFLESGSSLQLALRRAISEWRLVSRALRPRLLWVVAQHLELPGVHEEIWHHLVGCLEDQLLRIWRMEQVRRRRAARHAAAAARAAAAAASCSRCCWADDGPCLGCLSPPGSCTCARPAARHLLRPAPASACHGPGAPHHQPPPPHPFPPPRRAAGGQGTRVRGRQPVGVPAAHHDAGGAQGQGGGGGHLRPGHGVCAGGVARVPGGRHAGEGQGLAGGGLAASGAAAPRFVGCLVSEPGPEPGWLAEPDLAAAAAAPCRPA